MRTGSRDLRHDAWRGGGGRGVISPWRREALRTTLWVVPASMVVVAALAFAVTYHVDSGIAQGTHRPPSWAIGGDAAAARDVLIGVAAAVITVAGVVFSITILALQLASQQFGPRMLRNFIRDVGTQVCLGAFVATFVYSILTLGSVAHQTAGFVPHVSITVALVLTLGDLVVLIYFIHHVATSIQVTSVVAGIARDFRDTLEHLHGEAGKARSMASEAGSALAGVVSDSDPGWTPVPAHGSGFLQAIGHDRLVRIATSSNATVRLVDRPGRFVVEGQPIALVWPSEAANAVSDALDRTHIIGPTRTLTQDLGFTVDQLVEIAIRALSPAVNDTFTALNCIDWLGDCLSRAAVRPLPEGIYRDATGAVRLIDPTVTFEQLLHAATSKIRLAGRGMPAVLERQLENLRRIATALVDPAAAPVVEREAETILRASRESVTEPSDRDEVEAAFEGVRFTLGSHRGP
jgi:uncharacterized membrane protein